MRKELIAAASALALMTGAAFAQSTTGSTTGGSTGSGGTTTNSPTMQRSQDSTSGTAATAPTATQQGGMTASGASQSTLASAEKLLGKNVYGKDNEKVGEVEDIILDPTSGKAKHLVLSSGGFLGIGEKKVAVDFDQAKWNDADNRLQLSTLSRDDVKNMNEFKYEDNMTSLNRNRGDAPKGDASTAPANQRNTTGTPNPATPPSGTSQPKQ